MITAPANWPVNFPPYGSPEGWEAEKKLTLFEMKKYLRCTAIYDLYWKARKKYSIHKDNGDSSAERYHKIALRVLDWYFQANDKQFVLPVTI